MSLSITGHLGRGNFGVVDRGIWHNGKGMMYEVAIKSLDGEASQQAKVKLLQEAAIMGQFSHPNVLKLYGVVTDNKTVSISTRHHSV